MPIAGHVVGSAAQSEAVVQAEVGTGDVQADVEVATGAGVPTDVRSSTGR